MLLSSGGRDIEAAVLLTEDAERPDPTGLAALRELTGGGPAVPVYLAAAEGIVRDVVWS